MKIVKLVTKTVPVFLTTLCVQLAHAGERVIFTVGSGNTSNNEFQAQATDPVAVFNGGDNSRMYYSHSDMSPWLGASQGAGFSQIRTQTYIFRNLIPGRTYHLKIKFYDNGNVPYLQAEQNGYVISSHQVDKTAYTINYYWDITFQAQRRREVIDINNNHQPYEMKYGYIDYVQFTEETYY